MSGYFAPARRWFLEQDPAGGKAVADALESWVKPGSISLSDLGAIASGTLVGRFSPGTGSPELIAPASPLQLSASGALQLADSGVTVGSYGDGVTVASFTVDAKGILTAASNVAIVSAPKWTTARTLSFTGDATGSGSIDGSANVSIALTGVQAAKLTTARTFSYTGDATGGPTSFDGSANVSTALTLATVNSNVGTYGSTTAIPVVTVNAKGLVTAVSTASISTHIYAPLTNGTTPGPVLMADSLGQCIMAPIT